MEAITTVTRRFICAHSGGWRGLQSVAQGLDLLAERRDNGLAFGVSLFSRGPPNKKNDGVMRSFFGCPVKPQKHGGNPQAKWTHTQNNLGVNFKCIPRHTWQTAVLSEKGLAHFHVGREGRDQIEGVLPLEHFHGGGLPFGVGFNQDANHFGGLPFDIPGLTHKCPD